MFFGLSMMARNWGIVKFTCTTAKASVNACRRWGQVASVRQSPGRVDIRLRLYVASSGTQLNPGSASPGVRPRHLIYDLSWLGRDELYVCCGPRIKPQRARTMLPTGSCGAHDRLWSGRSCVPSLLNLTHLRTSDLLGVEINFEINFFCWQKLLAEVKSGTNTYPCTLCRFLPRRLSGTDCIADRTRCGIPCSVASLCWQNV